MTYRGAAIGHDSVHLGILNCDGCSSVHVYQLECSGSYERLQQTAMHGHVVDTMIPHASTGRRLACTPHLVPGDVLWGVCTAETPHPPSPRIYWRPAHVQRRQTLGLVCFV